MRVFFDSSALAKRYIREQGSEAVARALAEAGELAVSLLCPPEIISALSRLRREDAISRADYERAKTALFADMEDIEVCGVTVPVVTRSIELLERHAVRTIDAIHVATAIEWRADLFASSDLRQLGAASEFGLKTKRA